MCTPNRFLTGSLVWFPDLQFCAFIGNCCANDDVLAEAEKERKWRERRDDEETYLLAALPFGRPECCRPGQPQAGRAGSRQVIPENAHGRPARPRPAPQDQAGIR